MSLQSFSDAMGLAMMPCLSDQCRAAASQIASQNEDVIQIDFSRLKVTAFDEEDTDAVPSAWKAPQLWEPVIWRELDEAEAGCDRDRERGCNLPGLAVAGWCCWQTGGTFAAFLVELFAPEDPPQDAVLAMAVLSLPTPCRQRRIE
ncbi:unnamed protein product [Durusdinium trenchii]|uniref:Uncharacterized protein n=1 Tax=Durusdinium trenchii TaxID=1381693 RepID=A0ABP0PL29_9DINO